MNAVAVTSPEFAIRPGIESDLAWVKDGWRSTFHSDGLGAVGCERGHYHDEMTRLFERVFPRASVVVACDTQDPDVLLGFAVHTGPELHFVYVRSEFRRQGIARALLEPLRIKQFTFVTFRGRERIKPAERGWAFTPRWTLF